MPGRPGVSFLVMNTTRKTLVVSAALALGLAATFTFANPGNPDGGGNRGEPGRGGGRGPGMHAQQMQGMADYLGLTDAQKENFKANREKQMAALKTLHADEALTPEQRRAEAHAIHANFEGQRQALLTPEQKQKAEAMKAAVKERVQRRIKQHAPEIAQQETRAFLQEHRKQQRGK